MTEIDIWAIKERIVKILKANNAVYNVNPSNKNTYRIIQAGAPYLNDVHKEARLPMLFVTDDQRNDEIDQNVVSTDGAPNQLEHNLRFMLMIIVDGKDGIEAEKSINGFVKRTLEAIESNQKLTDPANSNDKAGLVHYSVPESIEILNPELIGHSKQGRVITLSVTTESTP